MSLKNTMLHSDGELEIYNEILDERTSNTQNMCCLNKNGSTSETALRTVLKKVVSDHLKS